MVRQWDMWQADLDPTVGHEQAGTRPALIVSSDAINEGRRLVIVVPMTSRKPGRRLYSAEALVPAGVAGLRAESVALVHQLRAVDPARLNRMLGHLDDEGIRAEVGEAIFDVLEGAI